MTDTTACPACAHPATLRLGLHVDSPNYEPTGCVPAERLAEAEARRDDAQQERDAYMKSYKEAEARYDYLQGQFNDVVGGREVAEKQVEVLVEALSRLDAIFDFSEPLPRSGAVIVHSPSANEAFDFARELLADSGLAAAKERIAQSQEWREIAGTWHHLYHHINGCACDGYARALIAYNKAQEMEETDG